MTHLIYMNDMSEYPRLLTRVLTDAEFRKPRDRATWDLGHTVIEISKPQRGGMPLGMGRRLNPAIGAVEALQLIAGKAYPDLVLRIAPQMSAYADEMDSLTLLEKKLTFHGAYGERIKNQVSAAIRKLTDDPSTRQAVITLWDPWMDNIAGKHDYPCTVMLQFELRLIATNPNDVHRRLDMNVVMRSNDAWLGFPYDVFQFTQLQLTVAKTLSGVGDVRVITGMYRHTVLSLHVYEQDIVRVRDFIELHSGSRFKSRYESTYQPNGVGWPGLSFDEMMERARAILDGGNVRISSLTRAEEWYLETLHGGTGDAHA